jgi:acyl-CoA dehydrogenase
MHSIDPEMKAELELFRDNVKRYLETEICPKYEEWEKADICPREMWNQLGEQGFLAVDIPEAYGGFETNFLFSMVVLEELSRANLGALAGGIAIHSDIVPHYILNVGTEEQKQKYLPSFVTGECVGAIAMTEPACGSDLQGMKTTAKLDGDEWVINGSKTFITNGQHADVVIVAARTNMEQPGASGTSLFLVDRGTPGFEPGQNLEKLGQHAGDTSELFFTDVRVPKSAMLGEQDFGFKVLMSELQRERLSLAVIAVATAEGALAETIKYVNERQAFGKHIAQFQNTKFKMAEMATEIRLNKALVDELKARMMYEEISVEDVSMAKYASTEMLGRVTDYCLQLHGGYGYMLEYPIARFYADARVQRIYGGTSEIMLELVSRSVLAR